LVFALFALGLASLLRYSGLASSASWVLLYEMSDDIAWHGDELFVCVWTEHDARGLGYEVLLAKYT
jgi:hypothetical protein